MLPFGGHFSPSSNLYSGHRCVQYSMRVFLSTLPSHWGDPQCLCSVLKYIRGGLRFICSFPSIFPIITVTHFARLRPLSSPRNGTTDYCSTLASYYSTSQACLCFSGLSRHSLRPSLTTSVAGWWNCSSKLRTRFALITRLARSRVRRPLARHRNSV